MTTFEPIVDHRARLERIQFEAAERRERALVDQCSPANTPEMRVRIWERLHQVRLPKSPTHAILRQVAKHTALELADVLEVQRVRAEALVVPETSAP
jgi:hypothetical protein